MQPRHDDRTEMGIIGAVILYPKLINEITIRPEDFYQPVNEQIWRIILDEARAGRALDVVTVNQRLEASGMPGFDVMYLHKCASAAPSQGLAEQHAEVITGLAKIRRMGDVAAKIIQDAQTAAWDDTDAVLDNARAALDKTLAEGSTAIKVRTFADALETAVDTWESPTPPGFATGWSDLDNILNGGWHPGQLTVLGARPAVGKSVIASCAAVAASRYGGAFFSLEMSETEVVSRMAAAASGVNLTRLTRHQLTELDWERIRRLAGKSRNWPVYIEERSRITMAQIRAHVRSMLRRGPVPLVIIDYAQLVTPADRSESRERQVSRIFEDCKHMAKEFGIHVLALAQVNRQSTKREDNRPTEADLRESGGIEAFADNIILLHREEENKEEIELIVAKNRHGQKATVRLVWRPSFASANNMAHGPNDYPHGIGERTAS